MNEILIKRIKGCLKTKISITTGFIVAYLITGNFGYAQQVDVKLKNEIIVNEMNSTIQFNGYKGMSAEESGKTALNNGIIENNGYYGMYASSGGTIVNNNTGIIKNTLEQGMRANGVNTTAINRGVISNGGHYGMVSGGGAISTNEITGIVKNKGIQGMRADSASTLINRGVVLNENNDGMWGDNSSILINDTTGVISNNGNNGIALEGNNTTAINKGEITNKGSYGMNIKSGSVGVNEGVISNTSHNGMVAENDGIATNKGIISNNGYTGLAAINGGIATNEALGKIENNGSNGIYVNEATGINKGTILNRDTYGMKGVGNSILLNEGVISNTSYNGMVVENGGTATNKGIISNSGYTGLAAINGGAVINEVTGAIENKGINGMYISGLNSVGINKGVILNTSNNGIKIQEQGSAINEVTGVVSNNGNNGIFLEGINSSAINKGMISNKGIYGMIIKNGAIGINEGIISNTSYNGMVVEGEGTATNKGIISNAGLTGLGATNGGVAINEVTGKIENKGEYGVYADGATGINKGIISNKGSYGMTGSNNSVLVNEGTISNTSYNGMAIDKGGTATNKGIISNDGYSGLVVINGGTVINEVTGTISNTGKYGMFISGLNSYGVNNGIISNNSNDGMYISNKGYGVNKGTINNKSYTGIFVTEKASFAKNEGIISNYGNFGMYSNNDATAINSKIGTINNAGDYGIYTSNNALGQNEGVISNTGNYGMYAYSGAYATNTGTISNTGDYGMVADGAGSTAVNYKTVSNGGKHKMGSFNGGTVINENAYGVVVNGKNEIGMIADGSGSTAINNGTIAVNGANSIGMVAKNKGVATNTGQIYINGQNSEGMKAESGGQIRNQGKIHVSNFYGTAMSVTSNSMLVNDGEIGLNSIDGIGIKISGQNAVVRNNGEINISGIESSQKNSSLLTQDSRGNQAMVIEEGAMFINNGLFTVDGDLDSSEMGGGDFVLEGGTVEADSIRGDYYASGALAWGSEETTNSDGTINASTEYEDNYSTYQMFKTDDMYADMYSNSAMFSVALTEQDSNGYYGIDMYRKDFNDIIDNQEYAKYLENNYTTVGGTEQRADLYKAYKLVTNENDLNKYVGRTFGETIYPAMMEQNYEIAKMNNKKIKSEVFNKNIDQEVGEYNYIGYATYSDSEDRKSDDFSDNDMKYSSVSLGVDKKITETTRIGILGTIGKTDISFDDGADREDDVYQLNAFGIYEKDGLKGTVNAYAGKIKGDLDRTLAFTSLHEKMEGDIESNFYGLNISLEKEYQVKGINLSPRLELNSMYMEEDSVRESGEYALDVNSTNGKSVEAGVGIVANKTIVLNEKYRLIPELSAMYYRELGNPYKDRSVKLSSVSSDSVTMKGYEEGKDTGEFDLNVGLEREGANLRVGVVYEVNDQGGITTPYMSLGYTF